jgi:hypothetical protein
MDTLPERIGDGGQFVLQTIQFLCEMSRVPQGAFPAILFVEIVGIGLPFELNEMSGTFRFVTTVVMVGDVVFSQAATARPLQRRT